MSIILFTSNGYELELQTDGNLVLYNDDNDVTWETNTADIGIAPYDLKLRSDGVLVLLDSLKTILWSSGRTKGIGPYELELHRNGNIVIYDSLNRIIWNSKQEGFTIMSSSHSDKKWTSIDVTGSTTEIKNGFVKPVHPFIIDSTNFNDPQNYTDNI